MLKIGELEFSERLILGTGKYPSFQVMQACHQAAETQLVTVAIRRVDLNAGPGESIMDFVDSERVALLPNTAGCYTAEEAIVTARLARELLGTSLLKLEVIGCPRTLFPDAEGTLEAARVLVADGFTVLPYVQADPVLCQRLEDLGCAAVMPLAAPIGSGLGVRNPENLRIIRELVSCPMIVDAGIGTASDCAIAMELGADAVLLNTAVAAAGDPVKMAQAMALSVRAGRLAFESGRMPRKLYASASSPMSGLIR